MLSRVFSVDIYRPLVVLKPGPKTAGQLECIVVVVSDLSRELLSSNLFLYVLFFFSSNMYILYSFVVFTCATTWSRLIYSLSASYIIRLPSFHPTHTHICNNNIDHDLYLSWKFSTTPDPLLFQMSYWYILILKLPPYVVIWETRITVYGQGKFFFFLFTHLYTNTLRTFHSYPDHLLWWLADNKRRGDCHSLFFDVRFVIIA